MDKPSRTHLPPCNLWLSLLLSDFNRITFLHHAIGYCSGGWQTSFQFAEAGEAAEGKLLTELHRRVFSPDLHATPRASALPRGCQDGLSDVDTGSCACLESHGFPL